MRILVTGSNGQLGNQFKELAMLHNDKHFTFTTRNELDITEAGGIEDVLKSRQIDCIINCASYTAVDNAETNIEEAMAINAQGAKNLALACDKANVFLIHFSTDYVYDGESNKPYSEKDQTNPRTIYGKSKLEGEKEIITNIERALIIRTAWLYSYYGKNFVKTILEKGKKNSELRVVYDQIGAPTYAYDLANMVIEILPKALKNIDKTEIYNYSNEGVTSWYDIAWAISDNCNLPCEITPVLSEEFQTKTQRPKFSLLNKNKIKNDFNLKIPYWRHSLEACLTKF